MPADRDKCPGKTWVLGRAGRTKSIRACWHKQDVVASTVGGLVATDRRNQWGLGVGPGKTTHKTPDKQPTCSMSRQRSETGLMIAPDQKSRASAESDRVACIGGGPRCHQSNVVDPNHVCATATYVQREDCIKAFFVDLLKHAAKRLRELRCAQPFGSSPVRFRHAGDFGQMSIQ
jgi:hypothetical protein